MIWILFLPVNCNPQVNRQNYEYHFDVNALSGQFLIPSEFSVN